MRPLQSEPGPFSHGETSFKNRDTGNIAEDALKLIQQARTVSIFSIFKFYGVEAQETDKKITCPFSFHKGGSERTASFYINKEKNLFKCFGCNHGGDVVEFVKLLENLEYRSEAANRILESFDSDSSFGENEFENFAIKKELMIDFSVYIRTFNKTHIANEKAILYMEKICDHYDHIMSKHILNVDGIKRLIDNLKFKLELEWPKR